MSSATEEFDAVSVACLHGSLLLCLAAEIDQPIFVSGCDIGDSQGLHVSFLRSVKAVARCGGRVESVNKPK